MTDSRIQVEIDGVFVDIEDISNLSIEQEYVLRNLGLSKGNERIIRRGWEIENKKHKWYNSLLDYISSIMLIIVLMMIIGYPLNNKTVFQIMIENILICTIFAWKLSESFWAAYQSIHTAINYKVIKFMTQREKTYDYYLHLIVFCFFGFIMYSRGFNNSPIFITIIYILFLIINTYIKRKVIFALNSLR